MSARFQAALALRDAGLRRWEDLGPAGQASLRSYVLGVLLRGGRAEHGVVRAQLLGCAAALTKRAWGGWDGEARAAALGELEAAAVGGSGGHAAAVALAALDAPRAANLPPTDLFDE